MKKDIRIHLTPDGIRTMLYIDSENGLIFVERKGVIQHIQEWDDSPMPPDMSINEVDGILKLAESLGYRADLPIPYCKKES